MNETKITKTTQEQFFSEKRYVYKTTFFGIICLRERKTFGNGILKAGQNEKICIFSVSDEKCL